MMAGQAGHEVWEVVAFVTVGANVASSKETLLSSTYWVVVQVQVAISPQREPRHVT